MKSVHWQAGVAGALLATTVFGVARLRAQAKATSTRTAIARPNALRVPASGAADLAAKAAAVRHSALKGTYLLLQYNPNLDKQLDLDDNGSFTDTGDRAIQQGDLWQSDASGHEIAKIGSFAAQYDYLDVSGQTTGTDLTETLDMLFLNGGQLRAGGFWNVGDGNNGRPALGIESATGAVDLRRYVTGQVLFIGKINDTEELYFLAR